MTKALEAARRIKSGTEQYSAATLARDAMIVSDALLERDAPMRAASQNALTALLYHVGGNLSPTTAQAAIADLRAALSQKEPT